MKNYFCEALNLITQLDFRNKPCNLIDIFIFLTFLPN